MTPDTLAALVKQFEDRAASARIWAESNPHDQKFQAVTFREADTWSLAATDLAEALAAIVAQPPCPVCGNEERHPRTDLLTCECPAALVMDMKAASPIIAEVEAEALVPPSENQILQHFDASNPEVMAPPPPVVDLKKPKYCVCMTMMAAGAPANYLCEFCVRAENARLKAEILSMRETLELLRALAPERKKEQ